MTRAKMQPKHEVSGGRKGWRGVVRGSSIQCTDEKSLILYVLINALQDVPLSALNKEQLKQLTQVRDLCCLSGT